MNPSFRNKTLSVLAIVFIGIPGLLMFAIVGFWLVSIAFGFFVFVGPVVVWSMLDDNQTWEQVKWKVAGGFFGWLACVGAWWAIYAYDLTRFLPRWL